MVKFIFLCALSAVLSAENAKCLQDAIDKNDNDPSLWPGHMEPFGSKQVAEDLEVLTEWPSAKGIHMA